MEIERFDTPLTAKGEGRVSEAGDVLTSLIVPVIQLEAHLSRAGEGVTVDGINPAQRRSGPASPFHR